jgi:SAM-dependent methyltransferase
MVQRDGIKNRSRSAQEVFDEIYKHNKWGGESGSNFSGTGSVGSAVPEYVALVNEFIKANSIKTVLDIGCGDFRVGRNIDCENYIGLDVAPTVIEANMQNFGSPSNEFICLDASGPSSLPAADLCLVRQVFQHLSNAQISTILSKVLSYRFVIVTEHQPSDQDFVAANLDKIHGPYTRLFSGSGVYLDRPPFSLRLTALLETHSMSDARDIHSRGKIRTFLVQN